MYTRIIFLLAMLFAVLGCATETTHEAAAEIPVVKVDVDPAGEEPEDDAVFGIRDNVDGEGVWDFLEPDQLLAYTVDNEEVIYVAEGMEEQVAADLNAIVKDDIWVFQEQGQEKEVKKKPLNWQDWYQGIKHVKWTYLQGMECKKVTKGTWQNVRNKRGKFLRSYQAPEDASYCTFRKGFRCKVLVKELETEFFTKPNGRGQKLKEKRKLSFCAP